MSEIRCVGIRQFYSDLPLEAEQPEASLPVDLLCNIFAAQELVSNGD